jgi:hypothetical protein
MTVKNISRDSTPQTRIYPNIKDALLSLISSCANDYDVVMVIETLGRWVRDGNSETLVILKFARFDIELVGLK